MHHLANDRYWPKVASLTAVKGRTMGHAGAIATTAAESAEEKVEILSEAGGRNNHAAFRI